MCLYLNGSQNGGKPFLSKTAKTAEETLDYVRCMTITQNVDPNIYYALTQKNLNDVYKYIDMPMTATTFGEQKKNSAKEVVTAELIYYWMIALNIPMECQKWHLNRLLTLVRVCNIKNDNSKNNKMSIREINARNAALNAERRKKLKTKG